MSARRPRSLLAALPIWLALLQGASASAQPLPSPLDVGAVVRIARERRQEIVASASRAQALGQRPAIEASLDQPMVMLSLDHLPFELHGADFSVALQQDFPLSGLLSRRREAAEAGARRARAAVDVAALDVELEAVDALLMAAERRRLGAVLTQQAELARELVRVGGARYAAGQGEQSDVIRAEAEAARIEALALSNARATRGAEAMVCASLALPADTAVPAVSLARSEADVPTPEALVEAALASRPELAAMRAERARSRAEVGVMESMYWPMAFVRLGVANTMQDGPGVMAMFGVTLPVRRARLHAGLSEATAMVRMVDADLSAMRTMIEGEVRARHADVMAASVALEAIRGRVLPLSRQAFDSTLASYAAGRVPVVSVVEALRMLTMVLDDEVMADVALARARARLDRATGALGGVR